MRDRVGARIAGADVEDERDTRIPNDIVPIELIESTIYGWEGDALNAYIKATTKQGQITAFEVDVNNDGTYDFAMTEYYDAIEGAVEFGLPGINLLPSQDDGEYPAKLRITNSLGTSSEFDVEIVVINAPTLIEFDENDVVGNPGVPFILDVSTSDPGPDTVTQIVIDWGDGSTDTISGDSGSPTHTYAAAGSYVIRATTTDEDESLWAEHEVQIGDIEPYADPGNPTIVSAFSVILGDNAQLTIEAEDSSGSPSGLAYEWDLDNDGIYELPGGSMIEIPPTAHFHRYSAALKITDSQGRSTDALFGFTQAGAQMPGPQTSKQGREAFQKVTPIPQDARDMKWVAHHTKQARLAQRYWDDFGINVHMEEHLRAVPEEVHVRHITPQQNAWWAKKAAIHGSLDEAYRLTPWNEIFEFENNLNGQFSQFWVPARADAASFVKAANNAREQRFILQITKASRWKLAKIIGESGLPVFLLLFSEAKTFKNMQNFSPDNAKFAIFIDKYEDCLLQAMGPAGRPSEDAAHQLVNTMIDFAVEMSPHRAQELDQSREALHAAVTTEYLMG